MGLRARFYGAREWDLGAKLGTLIGVEVHSGPLLADIEAQPIRGRSVSNTSLTQRPAKGPIANGMFRSCGMEARESVKTAAA